MFNAGTIGAAGGVTVVVSLSNQTVTPDSNGTFIFYAFRSGELVTYKGVKNNGVETVIPNEWVSVGKFASVGDGYEMKITSASNYWLAPAQINTWLALSTSRLINAGGPTSGSTFTVSIRETATGTVKATATYTFA